ncbi:hypothetical protein [Solibacillus isronensis]|uniref:hypothetical protein n=1 Tax=Solibacillus isronensis TaxID=412383 RepID=UPI0009A7BDCE|nr:hypothetical protein [Solibacillus isronensis]
MKKSLFIISTALLFLTACGAENDKKQSDQEQSIEVDKGLLDVELTLPADFFEDETPEEIEAAAKEKGVKEVKVNEDGTVYYKMSKSAHKKMMKEMEKGVISSVDDLVNGEDYESFKEISYNKDFTEFDVTVNSESFENSFDSFGLFGLAYVSMIYSAFDGKSSDELKTTVNIIDEKTGEKTDTIVFPDDIEDDTENSDATSEE